MNKTYSNPCMRCGKERILGKTWKEKLGNSIIINRQMICSDPDCQKKVDSENKKQQDKHTAMKLQSEQRALKRREDKATEIRERKMKV